MEKVSNIMKNIRIKIAFYLIFSFSLLLFYWYFVSTFCAVYKNTQITFIKDSLTRFSLKFVYPLFKYNLLLLKKIY